MSEARIIETGQVITAEELYFLKDVGALNYCCDECEIILRPCSYKKDVNLKRAYFKTLPNKHHKSWCSVKEADSVKKRGQKERVASNEGFPLSYPNRFKLRRESVTEASPTSFSPSGTANPRAQKQGEHQGRGRKSNYETNSFKSITDQYFDFPYDRDRKLTFEGVEGDEYFSVFKRIEDTKGKQQFLIQGEAKKVYYGAMSWKTAKRNAEDVLRIELSRGRWEEGKLAKPYYVEINMHDWPAQTKTKFMNRYEEIIALIRGTNHKALIAFVGTQDTSEDFFRFHTEHRLLIAFKVFLDD